MRARTGTGSLDSGELVSAAHNEGVLFYFIVSVGTYDESALTSTVAPLTLTGPSAKERKAWPEIQYRVFRSRGRSVKHKPLKQARVRLLVKILMFSKSPSRFSYVACPFGALRASSALTLPLRQGKY